MCVVGMSLATAFVGDSDTVCAACGSVDVVCVRVVFVWLWHYVGRGTSVYRPDKRPSCKTHSLQITQRAILVQDKYPYT